MSPSLRDQLSTPTGIVLLVLWLLGLGYAVVTANIFPFLTGSVSVFLTLYLLYLFYRLVVAVEYLAYEA